MVGKLGFKYWPIAKQAVVYLTYTKYPCPTMGPAEQFPEIRKPGRELVLVVVGRVSEPIRVL
jgi:hypothetical protein